MLRQGTLQEPFTSSPPTGLLKCVFPYMVRLELTVLKIGCNQLQKTSTDLHADFTTIFPEGKYPGELL